MWQPRARSRTGLRRSLVAANLCLALVGAGLVAYPFATDAFAEHWVQPRASSRLSSPGLAVAYRERKVPVASPLTRLRVPRLGIDVVVVEGVTAEALRAGAGHYPNTPLPGERGNVAIAGHRVTFGRPFRHMDRLRRGDTIELATPVGTFVYEASVEPFVVMPDDLSGAAPGPAFGARTPPAASTPASTSGSASRATRSSGASRRRTAASATAAPTPAATWC